MPRRSTFSSGLKRGFTMMQDDSTLCLTCRRPFLECTCEPMYCRRARGELRESSGGHVHDRCDVTLLGTHDSPAPSHVCKECLVASVEAFIARAHGQYGIPLSEVTRWPLPAGSEALAAFRRTWGWLGDLPALSLPPFLQKPDALIGCVIERRLDVGVFRLFGLVDHPAGGFTRQIGVVNQIAAFRFIEPVFQVEKWGTGGASPDDDPFRHQQEIWGDFYTKHILNLTVGRGRPMGSGSYSNADFARLLRDAAREVWNKNQNTPPTQEKVADRLGMRVRTMQRYMRRAGVRWLEVRKQSMN